MSAVIPVRVYTTKGMKFGMAVKSMEDLESQGNM